MSRYCSVVGRKSNNDNNNISFHKYATDKNICILKIIFTNQSNNNSKREHVKTYNINIGGRYGWWGGEVEMPYWMLPLIMQACKA